MRQLAVKMTILQATKPGGGRGCQAAAEISHEWNLTVHANLAPGI